MILKLATKLRFICSNSAIQIKTSAFYSNHNNNIPKKQQIQHLNLKEKVKNTQQQDHLQFTKDEQKQIDSYQPDQVFNIIMNVQRDRNLKKDLIVAKKLYERNTKQLRASILFQDLLKTQIKILIYDTKSKPFVHQVLKLFFYVFFFASSFWFINFIQKTDKKNKIILERTETGKSIKLIVYSYAIWTICRGLLKYIRFQRRFVQKIIYDTETQNFLITKRKFFGNRYNQEVSRYKLVYTQNKFLNKKGTNYFHIQSKEQYSIPYKQFWKKQDLFSHLIAQRIKL